MNRSKTEIFYTYLLILIAFSGLYLFWPGVLAKDSAVQYTEAITNIYSDHHPPLMSLYWHYLNKIIPGPGLMWLTHVLLLFSSMFLFYRCFYHSWVRFWFLLLPFLPQVAAYTLMVVKDAGFAYSYLLVLAIFAWLQLNPKTKFKNLLLLCCGILLFYGTAVKYQAKFILPLYTSYLLYIYYAKFNKVILLKSLVASGLILFSIFLLNNWLVLEQNKNHSWQLVKLYDLAAISLAVDNEILPEYIKHHPNYSFAQLKQKFDPREVNSLVFGQAPILVTTHNAQELSSLYSLWWSTILQYPMPYLHHRAQVFSYNLTTSAAQYSSPLSYFNNTKFEHLIAKPKIFAGLNYIFNLLKSAMQYIWLLPLNFLYLYLAIKTLSSYRLSGILLLSNVTVIIYLLSLFFFSMAGTARYVFICMLLTHISHPLAWSAFANYVESLMGKIAFNTRVIYY